MKLCPDSVQRMFCDVAHNNPTACAAEHMPIGINVNTLGVQECPLAIESGNLLNGFGGQNICQVAGSPPIKPTGETLGCFDAAGLQSDGDRRSRDSGPSPNLPGRVVRKFFQG